MKKFVYSALILGSAVALASCSADEPGAAKGDGNVTLTVQLPADAATRYGEGTSVTTLYYTVYAAGAAVGEDGTLPESLASGSVQWPAGKTQAQVELTLVPGDEYDVVFFADNEAAEKSGAYTYDASTAAFSIDYSKIASNSDDYDAFFTKYPKLSTATIEVIPLSRPFAQLNIGTNDWDLGVVKNHLANGGTYSSTLTFKAKGLAPGVNFFSGDYTKFTDPDENLTFNIDPIVISEEENDGYPVEGCKYLEMNYLLVVPAKDAPTLTEATYTVTAGTNEVNELDLTNLPLRANYQTNVYGALLSTKATFKVEIQEGFATPAYSYIINSADDLINALEKGGTYELGSNIYLDKPLTISGDKNVNLNLGNNKLSVGEKVTITSGGSLNITGDSESEILADPGTSVFYVANNGELSIDGVDMGYSSKDQGICCLIQVFGKGFNVTVKNATLDSQSFALSSNASTVGQSGDIYFENVEVTETYPTNRSPMLLNIPVNFTAKNCQFSGAMHAFVMRGGTYDFTDCTFTLTLDKDEDGVCRLTRDEIAVYRTIFNLRGGWRDGNYIPLAAVVMGNHSTAYEYPTNVTMTGCTINIPEIAQLDAELGEDYSLPAVYAYANQGEGLGVTFTFDSTTKINGAQEYASPNIIVNGVATFNYKKDYTE